ncbi:MAG: hypothetical protein NVS2B2_34740 [Ktedonobacteraceae bacterium]
MAACTRCGFEQSGTQVYCKRCGMFLPALAVYSPVQPEYRVVPQIVPRPNQRFLSKGNLTAQMVLNRCIREAIAIVGLFIAGFGIFGFFHDLLGSGWALLFGVLLLLGGIIGVSFLFFVQKLLPRLRWPQIVLGGIGATGTCFIIIIVVSAIIHNNTLGKDVGYGATIFFYGLVLATLVIL